MYECTFVRESVNVTVNGTGFGDKTLPKKRKFLCIGLQAGHVIMEKLLLLESVTDV